MGDNNKIQPMVVDNAVKVKLVERNPSLNILSLERISKKAPEDLVELAKQIQDADSQLKNNACGKLLVIAEQVRFLQKQAQGILEETARSKELHHVACNFQKVPGKMYHLYERSSGQKYFSMLSPQEWGSGLKDVYINSYRLEYDRSWTPIEKLQSKETENDKRWAEDLLSSDSKRPNILSIQHLNY